MRIVAAPHFGGWVKYGQRWYNPGIGRWTQMDTLDAPLDPANANRYAYAANDPVNNSDPLGLSVCSVVKGIASIFVSSTVGVLTMGVSAVATFGIGVAVGGFTLMGGILLCAEPTPPVNQVDPPDAQGCQVSPMNGSRWCY